MGRAHHQTHQHRGRHDDRNCGDGHRNDRGDGHHKLRWQDARDDDGRGWGWGHRCDTPDPDPTPLTGPDSLIFTAFSVPGTPVADFDGGGGGYALGGDDADLFAIDADGALTWLGAATEADFARINDSAPDITVTAANADAIDVDATGYLGG